MFRYKLTIEYNGSPYSGWQRQQGFMTVQQVLEEAITAFTGETVTVFGAGRTDAGVHALAQVAHIDLQKKRETDIIRDAVNAHMRDSGVAVVAVCSVDQNFDARFSATRRHYRYHIVNRRAPLTVSYGRAWLVQKPLDPKIMASAAEILLGHHDFSTFRSTDCQAKSPEKTLDHLKIDWEGDNIVITTHARSFLHSQVRSMVGSLKLVAEGRWSASDLKKALQARDRKACGPVAPPWGLFLARVDYAADR